MLNARHTRRHVLKVAMSAAAGVAFSGPIPRLAAQTPQTTGAQQLADDLFLLRIPGETNVLAQMDGDGVLLVDGVTAGATEALTKAVDGLHRGAQVRTIFNTHWHPEQTGSNEFFGSAGKAIIAHENTRLWLGTDVIWPWNGRKFKRVAKVAQPNHTFYTTGELPSGVRYGYIPDAAHTDGDMYVYFPKQNVLAVGDAVSADGWPVVDYTTGGWIGGMVGALGRIQTLGNDQTRFVSARGPVLGLAEIKAQHKMYSTIYDRLVTLLNRGRGPSEAVAAKPTQEFDAQLGNPDEFVRRAFESLWGYLSPDA